MRARRCRARFQRLQREPHRVAEGSERRCRSPPQPSCSAKSASYSRVRPRLHKPVSLRKREANRREVQPTQQRRTGALIGAIDPARGADARTLAHLESTAEQVFTAGDHQHSDARSRSRSRTSDGGKALHESSFATGDGTCEASAPCIPAGASPSHATAALAPTRAPARMLRLITRCSYDLPWM